jgi:hypothetical protein
MSKYLLSAILLVMSLFGWWLWHHKDADFVNAFCGSFTFFGMIICAIIILIAAPPYLPFG